MSRWGRCDFEALKKLKKKIDKLSEADYSKMSEEAIKELALKMLARVKEITPTDTGLLRNSWDITQVIKNGDVYKIEIFNPIEYATYVEYGHRTGNHNGWVAGKFMMTIAAKEIDEMAPSVVKKIIMKHLREVFNGD